MVALQKRRQRGVPVVILVMVMSAFVILVLRGYSIHSRVVLSSMSDAWEHSLPISPTSNLSRIGKFSVLRDSMNSAEPRELVIYTGSIIQPDDKGELGLNLNAKLINPSSLKDEVPADNKVDTKWSDANVSNNPFGLTEATTRKEIGDSVDGFTELKMEKTRKTATSLTIVSDGVTEPFRHSESHSKGAQNDAALLDRIYLENKGKTMSSANRSLSSHMKSHSKSTGKISVVNKYNKDRRGIPSVSFSEMNCLLLRNRASYRSAIPQWPSSVDKQVLYARFQIENAPILKNDPQLYAPVFRNVSMFMRSYELMEKILKVFVYKEGEKPIFHQPLLSGIYASEGWFMKMMETNRHFVIKDPRRANMFYLPFSSRLLQSALYVPNSHNRTKMEQRLKDYVDMIVAKYPFWNRTGGADHFVVACHDWAPIQTMDVMGHTIRALCNADIRDGYILGKDVSLLQSNVLSSKTPLKELGGKPPDQRSTLAFYAGNIHGTLRPILLHHWKDKDPDMKIFGPMPPSIESKTKYIEYMKKSKYCICPRGHEVNSPRIVEAILYECVPVIISDNYVLPFFEVLNWEAFSVIVAEVDVPRLKEILLSIPREKYMSLHRGVRKVQQHFVWHSKPVKYDAFHMILHNIWYSRVFTIRTT